jgi:putative ABC transport system ATP-binding protein
VAAETPVIELDRLAKSYTVGEVKVQALGGVSLTIERGEYVAIIGPSGSGKSTLMHLLGCLDAPTSGSYLLNGLNVSEYDDDTLADIRNRQIGFVFQSFNLIPRLPTQAQVELPLVYAGASRRRRAQRASEILAQFGLSDRSAHTPAELSGGQQQRVAIARAMMADPALILADEPTGNLDSHSTAEVMAVFEQLHEQGRTVVVITHEPEVAANTGRVIRLQDGLIIEDRKHHEA